MDSLRDKKILLGITGSIAAYKSALLVRLLVKAGAEVQVIMTEAAAGFISPVTLSTLSKRPVPTTFVRNEDGEWNNHVQYGLWADLMLIAPLSANSLSRMANGICDNLLTAVYLSARCPVWVAPAMDLDMYAHPSTARNLETVRGDGVRVIDAEDGELASGLSGQGRMAEPERLFQAIDEFLGGDQPLKGKKALVTAGPTREPLDPVRYISNHSSGKMGYAIAEILQSRGCEVTLISGPTSLPAPKVARLIKVETADQMHKAAMEHFPQSDITVLSAAVADFRPEHFSAEKIKKGEDQQSKIELSRNPDIAASIGQLKRDDQFVAGFALETHNEEKNALDKLKKKNFDIIVLNSLQVRGAGFEHDTNRVTIFDRHNNKKEFELKNKKEVAADIVHEIQSHL